MTGSKTIEISSLVLSLFMMCFITGVCVGADLTVKQDGSGDYQTVQEALDAASEGDTVIVSAGVYEEDINIGHFNVPSEKKDGITLVAADGEDVEIRASNTELRFAVLAAAGNDPGPMDRMGFIIHGNNITVEGIRFVQPSDEINNLEVNTAIAVGGADVTFRNCEIVGPGLEVDEDIVGLAIAIFDVQGIMEGNPTIATNLLLEDCTFTNVPYGFANTDFLSTGLPPEVTLNNCEFFGTGNAIEIDAGTTHLIDCYMHDNAQGFHISDDTTTITNCIIENNTVHGIEIDDQAIEDDEPPENPVVTIDGCTISNNGTETNHYGLLMDIGTLTMTNTIIQGSSGPNVFFGTESGRENIATLDHCDLYQSKSGVAVNTVAESQDIITFTMTNSIVVDTKGIINSADILGDFTVNYCDVYTTDAQFEGPFLSTENNLNVDPGYVDAANGNFFLLPDSQVATAGGNGTYMGSKGVTTPVGDWMLR